MLPEGVKFEKELWKFVYLYGRFNGETGSFTIDDVKANKESAPVYLPYDSQKEELLRKEALAYVKGIIVGIIPEETYELANDQIEVWQYYEFDEAELPPAPISLARWAMTGKFLPLFDDITELNELQSEFGIRKEMDKIYFEHIVDHIPITTGYVLLFNREKMEANFFYGGIAVDSEAGAVFFIDPIEQVLDGPFYYDDEVALVNDAFSFEEAVNEVLNQLNEITTTNAEKKVILDALIGEWLYHQEEVDEQGEVISRLLTERALLENS